MGDLRSSISPQRKCSLGGVSVAFFEALSYSFFLGLLHGILPDEHTWPITFSYAIGGASGKEGMKAGLYFSAAFTLQRMLISELAYFALAPFLISHLFEGIVYTVVGFVMSIAGFVVLRKNRYPHFHIFGDIDRPKNLDSLVRQETVFRASVTAPPVRWTVIHGFIAGFGFGGFSLFINTVAVMDMPGPWLGFLPGLLFGLGTMITLVIISAVFGSLLRLAPSLTSEEIKKIGAFTGGRTLFLGGILFGVAGLLIVTGMGNYIPAVRGQIVFVLFMVIVAIPAFAYSWKEVTALRKSDK